MSHDSSRLTSRQTVTAVAVQCSALAIGQLQVHSVLQDLVHNLLGSQ